MMTNLSERYIEIKKVLCGKIDDKGKEMILESFVELVEKSCFGEKFAEMSVNFSVLEQDGSGICKLLDYHAMIEQLASTLFGEVGYFEFEVSKLPFGDNEYMRIGSFKFDPQRKGISIKIPIR